MAEARVFKFCTQGDQIKSYQRDNKSCPKGHSWAHVTHFCMHNSGPKKILPRHAVNWGQYHRWQTSVARTFGVDANDATHYSSISIGSICCVFVANLLV